MSLARQRGALLRWYRVNRRDLPWRKDVTPYAIWVSEIMLQQTQVSTVLPYFDRFLSHFPDIATLASAEEEAVLARWAGLGYYRRARALHRGAQEVMQLHGGTLPHDAATLRTLPGIGRYTAGAIASIAFGCAEPILDGNVRRVLARWFGIDGARLGRAAEEKELWERAAELVQGASPGDFNQGLMELGATLCSPRDPQCARCPLRHDCVARRTDAIIRFPAATPRKASLSVRVAVAVIRRGDRVLLERPDNSNPLRGTWELPALELAAEGCAADELRRRIAKRHQLTVSVQECVGRTTHGILHRRLKLEAHLGRLSRGAVRGAAALRWVSLAELPAIAVSGATTKVLRLAAAKID